MENFFSDNKSLKFHLNHPLMEKVIRIKENDFYEKDQYDYAPQDVEDALENYEKVLEIIGEIAGEIIAPNAEIVDAEGPQLINNEVHYHPATEKNYNALVEANVMGMTLPRQYQGLNFPILPFVMSNEIIARADASFSNIWGLQDCAETINEFASQEIKDKFLPLFSQGKTGAMALTEPDAGSDLQAVQLKATYDENTDKWYLNGVKRFITNGDADISLVLARSEEGTTDGRGLSLFLYDRRDRAVKVRRIENKMGIHGSPTCELVFKNAPALLVGQRKLGLIKYVMSLMNAARLGVAAQSVGIAEAAYREGYKYAQERFQFGKPIIQFPPVYEMLNTMKAKLDAARTLMYETARFVDIYKGLNYLSEKRPLTQTEKDDLKKYQKLAEYYTPLVKLFSSEFANQITYDSLQIHGGSGYMKDYPIERLYRDARITNIYEGTSQLQVVAAIRGVTNNTFRERVDEYASLITHPELQDLKSILAKMTSQYDYVFTKIKDTANQETLDFHARRLVEMIGNIIISYLLLYDAQRNIEFLNSAQTYIKYSNAQNTQHANLITSLEEDDVCSCKNIFDID